MKKKYRFEPDCELWGDADAWELNHACCKEIIIKKKKKKKKKKRGLLHQHWTAWEPSKDEIKMSCSGVSEQEEKKRNCLQCWRTSAPECHLSSVRLLSWIMADLCLIRHYSLHETRLIRCPRSLINITIWSSWAGCFPMTPKTGKRNRV